MNDSEPSFADLETQLASENTGVAQIRSWSFAARATLLFVVAAIPVVAAFFLSSEWHRDGFWPRAAMMILCLAFGLAIAGTRFLNDPALKLLEGATLRTQLRMLRGTLVASSAMLLAVHVLHDASNFRVTYVCGAMSLTSGLLSGVLSFCIARRPSWIASSMLALLVALSSLEVACGELSWVHRVLEHVLPLVLVVVCLRMAAVRQHSGSASTPRPK